MAQGQSSTPVHTSQQLKGHGLNQGETGEARRKVRRRAERDRAAIGMADHMGGGWSANRSRLSRRAWLATGRRKAGGAACCGLRPALARSKRSWRRCATPTCGRCGHRAVRQRWSCTAAATGPCALKQVATWPPPSLGLDFIELAGNDHWLWADDQCAVLEEVRPFVRGVQRPRPAD